ncbi:androgen-induced gene 1 protein isoform X2 [Paroedura picta]|uniref:androgen-induced gene 1 protein isoform X2 n=1 Tax=Paroedura picta TaxID=143630 RepID=UPI004056A254
MSSNPLGRMKCTRECSKRTSRELAEPLSIIFGTSLRTGDVPEDWKRANVIPIFKKGRKEDPGNYRPFVVTLFWSVYIYDRELVYPKLLDNFIPPWLNHGMHTTVLPFILIEMRTTHHEYPSRSSGLIAMCTFSIAYILWVCWIYHVTGVWVYPLLDYLGSGAKIIFFATVTAIINVFYLLGEVLNNCIWDTQKCMEEGKEKTKLD